jgi:hypothetical protein
MRLPAALFAELRRHSPHRYLLFLNRFVHLLARHPQPATSRLRAARTCRVRAARLKVAGEFAASAASGGRHTLKTVCARFCLRPIQARSVFWSCSAFLASPTHPGVARQLPCRFRCQSPGCRSDPTNTPRLLSAARRKRPENFLLKHEQKQTQEQNQKRLAADGTGATAQMGGLGLGKFASACFRPQRGTNSDPRRAALETEVRSASVSPYLPPTNRKPPVRPRGGRTEGFKMVIRRWYNRCRLSDFIARRHLGSTRCARAGKLVFATGVVGSSERPRRKAQKRAKRAASGLIRFCGESNLTMHSAE